MATKGYPSIGNIDKDCAFRKCCSRECRSRSGRRGLHVAATMYVALPVPHLLPLALAVSTVYWSKALNERGHETPRTDLALRSQLRLIVVSR